MSLEIVLSNDPLPANLLPETRIAKTAGVQCTIVGTSVGSSRDQEELNMVDAM